MWLQRQIPTTSLLGSYAGMGDAPADVQDWNWPWSGSLDELPDLRNPQPPSNRWKSVLHDIGFSIGSDY